MPPPEELHLTGEWTRPKELIAGIWEARDLCTTLARKEFFVRYRRASFGVLWAVALPALQATVLGVIMSHVAKLSVPHYTAFIFSGIVGWSFFATVLSTGSNALVENSSLSSRIYFARAVLPLATCLSNVFALVIGLGLLLVIAIATGAEPGWHTLYLIPACVFIFAITASTTLVLSAATVYFRDTRYAVQASLLVWFYIVPVFYPVTLIHNHVLRLLIEADPLTGPIQLFHLGAIGGLSVGLAGIMSGLVWTTGLSGLALLLYCRFDRVMADLL